MPRFQLSSIVLTLQARSLLHKRAPYFLTRLTCCTSMRSPLALAHSSLSAPTAAQSSSSTLKLTLPLANPSLAHRLDIGGASQTSRASPGSPHHVREQGRRFSCRFFSFTPIASSLLSPFTIHSPPLLPSPHSLTPLPTHTLPTPPSPHLSSQTLVSPLTLSLTCAGIPIHTPPTRHQHGSSRRRVPPPTAQLDSLCVRTRT